LKKPELKIYNSADRLIEALNYSFIEMIHKVNRTKQNIHIALSGGNTPQLFFKRLAKSGNQLSWQNVHFYWGDERCVPPEHPDSNFGTSKKHLFDKIKIYSNNLHRIYGENDPNSEAERYGEHILHCIQRHENNYPIFDWIILGLGEDGHTASIFPGDIPVIQSTKICTVASHPQTDQKRVTLTLPVINRAERITFLVSGHNKAGIIAEILNNNNSKMIYPAAMVESNKKPVEWYLDKEAVAML
jgi:6-phosphogluconolactonase